MRRALLLSVLALALASPAGAQQGGRITVITPSPLQAGGVALRGALSSAPASATSAPGRTPLNDPSQDLPDPAAALALSPARPPAGGLSTEEVGQCRLSCAQTYYFCLAQDAAQDCSPQWGQCRAACDAPEVSRDLAAGYLGQNP
ncbi:hypothetical protein [Phenylobacterium aquaticum]|uniref:hypothetical protein n=1 Tax=Phenylobacterium aquaticum TaxID=1763816 RepID=UPI0026EF5289|nr:hypothetical protein [Phenylobacterium aquaticum]